MEKCLIHLIEMIKENPLKENKEYKIVIPGAIGGRLDHTLNNIKIVHGY